MKGDDLFIISLNYESTYFSSSGIKPGLCMLNKSPLHPSCILIGISAQINLNKNHIPNHMCNRIGLKTGSNLAHSYKLLCGADI